MKEDPSPGRVRRGSSLAAADGVRTTYVSSVPVDTLEGLAPGVDIWVIPAAEALSPGATPPTDSWSPAIVPVSSSSPISNCMRLKRG